MNDIPDPDEDVEPPPPRKTSPLAWAMVCVIFLVVIFDILGTRTYDNQNNRKTFQRIGSVTGP